MKRPMVAPFDLLCSLLMVFAILALISVPKQKQSQIETLGYYAITAQWPDMLASDVDLWVRAPTGEIVYFGNSDGEYVSLEHDDVGLPDNRNYERAIIRQIDEGEFVVNVHMFRKSDPGNVPVVVSLWRLRGQDKRLTTAKVTLQTQGQEQTAFRFDPPGRINHLPARMVS